MCLTSLKVGYLYNIDLKDIYRFFLKDSSNAFEYLKFVMYGKQNWISVGGNKHVYECESINHNKILCSINVEYGFYEDIEREQKCKEIKKARRRESIKYFLRHPFKASFGWINNKYYKIFYNIWEISVMYQSVAIFQIVLLNKSKHSTSQLHTRS